MKSKMYLAIVITISSIFTFALIATTTGTTFSIFENVVAQEGAVNPTDSGNNSQIDKDKGTTRSSTDFSAINDTTSD
jgi:hypothetical protein